MTRLRVALGIAGVLFAGCGAGDDCEPRSSLFCDQGKVYWVDSCGNLGAVADTCECGCNSNQTGCDEACGCNDHYDCNDSSVCVYGECENAYGQRYEISVDSVLVSQYDQNNEAWDSLGGMPDPFVCVYLNIENPNLDDMAEYCTTAVQDTFTPSWGGSFQADIYEDDRWVFMAWDEDISEHDYINGVYAEPIDVSAIKAGGFSWGGDYLENLEVSIELVE